MVKILGEVSSGKTVCEICQAHGLTEGTYYVWKRKYSGLAARDVGKLRDLEHENSALSLLADQMLENTPMKKLIQKNGWRQGALLLSAQAMNSSDEIRADPNGLKLTQGNVDARIERCVSYLPVPAAILEKDWFPF